MNIEMEPSEKLIYHVYHKPGADFVIMEWNGYANSKQFREGTEKMFSEMKKYNVNKVLGAIQDMVLIGLEDQTWLLEQFLPKAIEGGLQAVAFIRPMHYFNKVAVETVAYKVNQEKLSLQFFNDVREATEWLSNFTVKQ